MRSTWFLALCSRAFVQVDCYVKPICLQVGEFWGAKVRPRGPSPEHFLSSPAHFEALGLSDRLGECFGLLHWCCLSVLAASFCCFCSCM